MKTVITIEDYNWEQSIMKMVFTDETGKKYAGKTHSVSMGKSYSVEVEDKPAKDKYINIVRWL